MKRLVVSIVLNLGLAACAQVGDDAGFRVYPFVLLAALSASAPLVMILHELGHAAAGRLVGRRIYYVALGEGEAFGSFQIGETQIVFGRDLTRGYVMGFPVRAEARWRASLFLLGGVLANLTAAAAAALLAAALTAGNGSSAGKIAASAAVGFAVTNILTLLLALLPRMVRIGEGKLASDGRRLFELWRKPRAAQDYTAWHDAFHGERLTRAGRWDEAQAHYEAALARAPGQVGFLGGLLHVIGRSHGAHAVLGCWLERREAFDAVPDVTAGQRAHTWGNVAWQALRTGDAAHFDLADDLSERALAGDPSSPPIRATRGAVLMAKGEREAGLELLAAGLRGIANRDDKAEFCAFLAQDAERRGEAETAAGFAALEQRLLARA